jgi:hypothetical protein
MASDLIVRRILDDQNHDDLIGAEGPVGAWSDFIPDPGWLNSTFRYRITRLGLQFAGAIQAPLPANARARMGVLPVEARPARNFGTSGGCLFGVAYGWSMWEFDVTGAIWTYWSLGEAGNNGTAWLNTIVPLD